MYMHNICLLMILPEICWELYEVTLGEYYARDKEILAPIT